MSGRTNGRLNIDVGSGTDGLRTPAMLLDLNVLEENIRTYAEKAGAFSAERWTKRSSWRRTAFST